MNLLNQLFAANKFKQGNQRCLGGNGLPFAHHALRINNFAGEHGATVHGKLQDMNHLFAAIHFHVRACGHKVSTPLSLLGGSVIEQAPKGSNGAVAFDGAVIDINYAGIGGGHFLPFCLRRMRRQKHQQTGHQGHAQFRSGLQTFCVRWKFKSFGFGIHAPYYKVVH